MLHQFHYYACYYALLCLLHQHQQAASLTIIIDGATTNEWATRDEYQRLVGGESGAAEAAPSPFGQQQQLARGASGQVVGRYPVSGGPLEAPQEEQQQQQQQRQLGDQQFEPAAGSGSGGGTGAAAGALAAAAEAAEGFESALDRLDLMEAAEQKRRAQQLQRLRQLEQERQHQLQPHHSHMSMNPNGVSGNQRQQQPVLGARTLNDLVPAGDDDPDDPMARIKERGSAPRKFCGQDLVDVLDMVCQGRFYSYEEDAQTVYPSISKRFVDYDRQQQQQSPAQQQLEKPERRRKLRTLNDDSSSSSSTQQASPLQATENNGENQRKQLNINNNNNDPISHYPSQDNNNNTPLLIAKHNSIINDNNENNNYPTTNLNTNNNNIRNRHSRMAHYRRIRGASAECCKQACHIEQLKSYCSSKKP